MIEYQGWATIREAYREEFEDDARLREIAHMFGEKVKHEQKTILGQCMFSNINGFWRFFILGNRNHSGAEKTALELFNWLAINAPGSYGVLSIFDDEDESGMDNEFAVYVLKKGTLTLEKDTFLSPYFPEVEEHS